MINYIMIAVGGALGSVARFGMSSLVQKSAGIGFPYGTLSVNIVGCFVIGIAAEMFEDLLIPSEWRSFVTIGFLGGFTTFSAFSLETVNLIREGESLHAIANVALSNILGIAAVVAGVFAYRAIRKYILN
ncbi:MAG: fluoride efflux transporter CrcB [Ignavibacteria bacterium]|nr:fluoride efflux transporter CrcB [Ignavibacteria bacterium]